MIGWCLRRLWCEVFGHEWRMYDTDRIPPLRVRLCLRCDWMKQ
jgi:hypothetical protein